MNQQYLDNKPATILSYDGKSRTARVHIPSVTDGVTEGIIATFAYPVGDDDFDTERRIMANTDCYVFFQSGDPSSPVIFAFRSHGTGAVVDMRRIRQTNIQLLADAGIDLKAKNITLEAESVTIKANTLKIDANTTIDKSLHVKGQTTLGKATIDGRDFTGHGHKNVQTGNGNSGGVV